MSEKINKPSKSEDSLSQEKHELEEDLYGRLKDLFEKEHEKYGKNYPEVGWVSEPNFAGAKLKITKVFEKDGDPYIEYFYIYDNEEEKEGKEDNIEKNLESPEKASEKIVKKVEETNKEIKKNVEEHKGLEDESSAGVKISGADKLEEEREEIVRKSKDRLDDLTKREDIVGDKNELYDNIKHLFLNKYGDSLPKVGWEIDHEGEKKIITRVYERDKKLYVWYKEEGLKEDSENLEKEKNVENDSDEKKAEIKKSMFDRVSDSVFKPDEKLAEHKLEEDKELKEEKLLYKDMSQEELESHWNDIKIKMKEANKNDNQDLFNELSDKIIEIEGELKKYKEEEIKNEESIEIENFENESQDYSMVTEAFSEFNIDSEDLNSIKGFNSLNIGEQLLIAKNLKNIALEEIREEVKERQKSAYKDKNFISKIGVGISNIFKKRGQENTALEKQKLSGLEKNKTNIENYISLIKSMDLKGEIVNGKEFFSFVDNKSIGPEKEALYKKFNEAANLWSEVPEHYNEKYAKKDQKRQYKKALENYQKAKEEFLNGEDYKKAEEVNNIDLQISLLKTTKADPDIEKDWNNLGKSGLKKFFTNLDKPGYLVAGYGARALTASLVGAVAVPLTAAGLGAWRGYERGKKNLRESDKDKSKKEDISKSQIFIDRKEAYNKLQDFYVKNKVLVNEKGERIISEEVKSNPEYQEILKEYKKLDDKLNKVSEKSIDKKTELSEKLGAKLDKLINYYNSSKKNESIEEERKRKIETLKMIDNRIRFSKDKLSNDLINFGSNQEKAKNLLNFYQKISHAELFLQLKKDELLIHDLDKASFRKKNGEEVNINERIKQAFSKYEEITGKKLSKNRKNFLFKKVRNGALMSGAFALAGIGIREGVEAFKDLGDEAIEEVSENVNEITSSGVEEKIEDTIVESEVNKNLESLSKVISNENLKSGQTDSIWRSSRLLFMENAEKFGYEGDINDTDSLRSWADNQVANALNRSGDINELVVHEGNVVSLVENQNGEITIEVEKGSGEFSPSAKVEQELQTEKDIDIPKKMKPILSSGIETKGPYTPIEELDNQSIEINEAKEIITDNDKFEEFDEVSDNIEDVKEEGIVSSESDDSSFQENTSDEKNLEEVDQVLDEKIEDNKDLLSDEKNLEDSNLEKQTGNSFAEKLAFNLNLRSDANDLVDGLYSIKDNDLFNNVEKIQDLYKAFDEEIVVFNEKYSLAEYFKMITEVNHEDLSKDDKEDFLKAVADVVYAKNTGILESRKIEMFNVLKNIIEKY